jgi:hypothetical protein
MQTDKHKTKPTAGTKTAHVAFLYALTFCKLHGVRDQFEAAHLLRYCVYTQSLDSACVFYRWPAVLAAFGLVLVAFGPVLVPFSLAP